MSTLDSRAEISEDMSRFKFEASTPLEHVSLLNSGPTTKEQLKVYCKPTYRMRRLKNKGAIMVLIWNYLITSVLHFSTKKYADHGILFNVQLVTGGLTLPIAGWLADVYFGRYKVIRWSMWIMWITTVLAIASSIAAHFVHSYNKVNSYTIEALMIIMIVGLGGFQANAILFGIDQLHDASTNEITSFISWFVWSYYGSKVVIDVVLECTQKEYRLTGTLVICTHLSIALSSMFLFKHWLVKEPVTQNPFKLVYKVIKYAINNKYPRYRSAFTYCEDDLPSRIDFGKTKYGGPFTTEQVEDVKTFLRMVPIILAGSILLGGTIAVFTLRVKIFDQLISSHGVTAISHHNCYSEGSFKYIFIYSGAIAITLHELFFHPVFHRCLAKVSSHRKFLFGLLLHTATIITLMLLEIVARHSYLENTNSNNSITIHCVYYETHGTLSSSLDYRWMAIPDIIYSISIAALGIGAIEFIVAQTPYSMRGLIAGTAYGMFILSAALGIAITIPFTKRLPVWGTGIISCGFWHALLLLVIEVTMGITLTVIMKWYKKRKREDVLPNEHIFAERYYAREN